jgi:hypothetical protein
MNLYRYRVVERTTTIKKASRVYNSRMYHLQRSVLGIMWADIKSYINVDNAIEAYDNMVRKEEVKEKVIHPVKQ